MRASNVPVLALEEPGSDARRVVEAEIERALAEDGVEAIVLGCAGMTDLMRELERSVGAPVLDGVACAVGLTEALVRVGLRTSKRNTYAHPLAKAYAGEFAKFSPRCTVVCRQRKGSFDALRSILRSRPTMRHCARRWRRKSDLARYGLARAKVLGGRRTPPNNDR